MEILADYSIERLSAVLKGLPAFRARQLFKWISLGASYEEMTDLPKDLRESLKKDYLSRAVVIEKEFLSKDGSVKLLFKLNDGNRVEGIFMPHGYGNTLCVSTQVGCRMNCAFCASSLGGLIRNLSAGEIYSQVIEVNKRFSKGGERALSNIVLMGMGEPLDNYENVTEFIRLVTSREGLDMSQRGISLSTCGLSEQIKRLADENFSVTMSISLHATTDEAREKIMPIAKRHPLSELTAAARYYFEKTGRRIAVEYALIKENMTVFDVKRLKELFGGMPFHVNLIMINYVPERNVAGCTKEEADRFLERLTKANISATIRRSSGQDIAGACGQLRNKFIGEK